MLMPPCASPCDGRGAPGDVTTHGSRDGIKSGAQRPGEVAGTGMGQIQTSDSLKRVRGSSQEVLWKGHSRMTRRYRDEGVGRVALQRIC
jgi:hypothetical protein